MSDAASMLDGARWGSGGGSKLGRWLLLATVTLLGTPAAAETLEEQLEASARRYDEVWYRPNEVFEKFFVCADLPKEHYEQQIAAAQAVLAWIPYSQRDMVEVIEAQIQLGDLKAASANIQRLREWNPDGATDELLTRAVEARSGKLEHALREFNRGIPDTGHLRMTWIMRERVELTRAGTRPEGSLLDGPATTKQRSVDVFGVSEKGSYDPLYGEIAWLATVYGKAVWPDVYFTLAERLIIDKSPVLAVMAYEKAREYGHPIDPYTLPGYAELRRRVEQEGHLARARAALKRERERLLQRGGKPGKYEAPITCQVWKYGELFGPHYQYPKKEEIEAYVVELERLAARYDELRGDCAKLHVAIAAYRREHGAKLTVSYATSHSATKLEATRKRFFGALERIKAGTLACPNPR